MDDRNGEESFNKSNDILSGIKLHYDASFTDSDDKTVILRKNVRLNVPWEEGEVKALIEGVKAHGEKNWTKILNENAGCFKSERRPIDLVVKYNQLTKKSSFYKTAKRTWVELEEENLSVKTNEMGDEILCNAKFPYEAAMKILKRERRIRTGDSKIILMNYEDHKDIHAYKYFDNDGRIILKKIILN